MITLFLKRHKDKRIQQGHLWIFSNELQHIPANLTAGTLVEIKNADGKSFGTGFFNPHSLVAVRLLKSDTDHIDQEFFKDRFAKALKLRTTLFPGSNIYRLVFGESDLLPGLIIDRFDSYFVLQTLTWGMEIHINDIFSALIELISSVKGILAKNTSQLRSLENLPLNDSVLFGNIPETYTTEIEGLYYDINLAAGQKTGFFLDQRLNRIQAASFCNNLAVLDCFTNQGGFALHAAKKMALSVTAVDVSEHAIQTARKNAELNKTNQINFIVADVIEYLSNAVKNSMKWDMIILDPPSFTKSKKTIPSAKKGYQKINDLALQCLNPGGFLVTASCSHHLYEQTFLDIIHHCAIKNNKQLKIIFRGQQSPDHPVYLPMPETRYLKFFIFQIIY